MKASTFLLLPCVSLVTARVAPVEIQNYKFFDSESREEFVIKGIDYYPRPNAGDLNANSVDLFTDEHSHIWERDIPFLKNLGVNAIRIYAVNATADHDAFMCAMEAAGIYVIVGLGHDCPTCAITRDASPDCYPPQLKTQGQAVINAFAKYSNTLAFSAGNEVNHFAPIDHAEWNAPCQKKFLRDMRHYLHSCAHLRKVPIGLVSADTQRDSLAKYYNCHTNPDDIFENAEWYGLNAYVSCDGNATTYNEALGFQLLGQSFESYSYSVPVVLTEFGCIDKSFPTQDGYEGQRNFLQAKWMLEEPFMRDIFSGGFAFEYSIEMAYAKSDSPYPFTHLGGQNYGVGHFANETCDDIAEPCLYVPHPSFYNLKKAYDTAQIFDPVTMDNFSPSKDRLDSSECPSQFPALSDFSWSPDKTKNLACPRKGTESQFICPASYKTLLYQEQMQAGNKGTFHPMVITSVLVVALCLFVYRMARSHRRDIDINGTGSFSDESVGLLSLKEYLAEGGIYQALSSDSSSGDLSQHQS